MIWGPGDRPPVGHGLLHGHRFRNGRAVFRGRLPASDADAYALPRDQVVGGRANARDKHSRMRDVRIGPEGAVYGLT